jgi:DNA-binding MarR family transcriptional regulator
MGDDLRALAEDLITTSARIVRWVPESSTFTGSLSAVRILARLHDNGPIRIGDLAVAERTSQPTITNHIKRMEESGLVRRSADVRDARARMIELTPQGEEQLRQLRDSLGTRLEPYLARMSRPDREAIRQGIEAMHRLMSLQA